MKTHLIALAVLGLTFLANAGETRKPEFQIQYNSSDLTVITVDSDKLNCTWHTRQPRSGTESYMK